MSRFIGLTFALFCLAAPGAWAAWHSVLQIAISGGGGGGYVGPADVIASPTLCYSMRACSSALRGTAAINVCDDIGMNCADVLTDATTGALPTSIVRGSNTCQSTGTCTVATVYDQIGTGCSGNCNVTQAVNSARPMLVASCIPTNTWCLTFTGGGAQFLISSNSLPTQTVYTFGGVAQRVTSFTTFNTVFGTFGQDLWGFSNAANTGIIFGGSSGNFPATDSVWNAMEATNNGASSIYNVNGSGGTISNPGSGNVPSGLISLGQYFSGMPFGFDGWWEETVLWSSAIGATPLNTLALNQKSFWGF